MDPVWNSSGTELRLDGEGGGDANPIDYSNTNDDQILYGGADGADDEDEDDPAAGLEADGEEAEESGDGEEAEGDGQDEGEEGEAARAAAAAGKDGKDKGLVDKPTTDIVEPEALKPVFKAHPELRKSWYAEKAYREVIPTVAEARQYREIAPTLDNLKYIQTQSQELEALDDLFFSDNPADTQTFIQGLHKEDPRAFARLAQQFPGELFKLDPEAYRNDTAGRMRATFDNLERLAGNDAAGQNLKNAIAVIRGRLKLTGTGAAAAATDPREADIQRREQALRDQDQQREQQKFADFHEAANDDAITQTMGLIEAELKAALKDTPITEKARRRMAGDVYNEIDATLKAQRDLRRTLRQAFKDGKLDQTHQKKVVSLVVGRAKQLIKSASTKVINEWTNDYLANNKTRIDNKRRAAARTDVTGAAGAGAGAGAKPKTPTKATDIDYRKTSDDDILEGKATARAARK